MESSFKFDYLNLDFRPSSFICNGCSNSCEVIDAKADGEIIAVWGDRVRQTAGAAQKKGKSLYYLRGSLSFLLKYL